MAGSLIGRATACVNHPIAAWMTHGTADNAAIGGVEFTAGEAARGALASRGQATPALAASSA
jgi:hypothetical protein